MTSFKKSPETYYVWTIIRRDFKTLSVAQGLADSPIFPSSKNPRTFSQIFNINE